MTTVLFTGVPGAALARFIDAASAAGARVEAEQTGPDTYRILVDRPETGDKTHGLDGALVTGCPG